MKTPLLPRPCPVPLTYSGVANDAARAAEALARIGFFCDVEREAKTIIYEQKLEGTQADSVGLKMRRELTLPKIQEFKNWLDAQARLMLPKSPITQASNYARNHWEALLRFTEHDFLNIDTNASEPAIRPLAARTSFSPAATRAAASPRCSTR